jgi:cobyrinic acid a,c-diamide synthase
MSSSIPRLVIAGLSGDSGKTLSSLALLAVLRRRGLTVSVFKKGPDYIDSAWLSKIAGVRCRNLDTYLVDSRRVFETFVSKAAGSGIAIIEGNRGLFDGKDARGSHSTAELAKLLCAPVVLVVDVTKTTRTIAALINGCLAFDPELKIAGVILNRVAGSRHEDIIKESIKEYCKLPVLGALPKLGDAFAPIPSRHLGLIPPSEHETAPDFCDTLADLAEKRLDIDSILKIATDSIPLDLTSREEKAKANPIVKIGYFHDRVFTFYYPENLEALENAGAELVVISSLGDKSLPDIDALYIGGGFPETNAELLAGNNSMLESVKTASESGLPIFAECGGLMYLCRSIQFNGHSHPMSGVFPIDLKMNAKPVGHGYVSVKVAKPSPFFPLGTVIRGHEFHYSGPDNNDALPDCCFEMAEGYGLDGKRDGLLYKNTLAAYTHIHASGIESWASAFIKSALVYRKGRLGRKFGRSERVCGSK